MQHAVDLHGGDRRALQRGQQHAAQRVAERQAEAALERLGDDASRSACGSLPGDDLELVRLDQFLPVLLDHDALSFQFRRRHRRIGGAATWNAAEERRSGQRA